MPLFSCSEWELCVYRFREWREKATNRNEERGGRKYKGHTCREREIERDRARDRKKEREKRGEVGWRE